MPSIIATRPIIASATGHRGCTSALSVTLDVRSERGQFETTETWACATCGFTSYTTHHHPSAQQFLAWLFYAPGASLAIITCPTYFNETDYPDMTLPTQG